MKFYLFHLLQNTAQAWWTTALLLVLPSLFLFLLQTICTYLLEILPLAPTAEYCTSLVDNSTTFGTPEFVFVFWLSKYNLHLLLVNLKFYLLHLLQNSAQAWWKTALLLVLPSLETPWQSTFFTGAWIYLTISAFHHCTHRFLAGLFTFLSRWPIVNWLRASKRNHFRTIITTIFLLWIFSLSLFSWCKMWSVPHANEWQETSNVGRNWHLQWTTTDFVWRRCHPPWPGSCQVSKLMI